MARSAGSIHISDNSVTSINDAIQQLLFLMDELRGEHDSPAIKIGPHSHAGLTGADGQDGGFIDVPAQNIDHDDLINVTTDQHHAKLHETSHRNGAADALKLDDLATPDDNTDLDASTTKHGLMQKYPNDSAKFLDGAGNFSTVPGSSEAVDVANIDGSATDQIWEKVFSNDGSVTISILANGEAIDLAAGGGTPIWQPDRPPASAGADDDEFDGNSGGVPTGWTEMDIDGNITVGEDNSGLTLVQATHTGNSVGGVYKAIPAGDFTIWTKLSMSGQVGSNFIQAGLALMVDPTSSTDDLVVFRVYMNITSEAASAEVTNMSDYVNFGTVVGSVATLGSATSGAGSAYLRIRRTGTTYGFDFSTNGIAWYRLANTTIAITPAYYGIVINNNNTGADQKVTGAFFRYLASDVGFNGLVGGKRT